MRRSQKNNTVIKLEGSRTSKSPNNSLNLTAARYETYFGREKRRENLIECSCAYTI
jgi:hypothetical protein